MTEVERLERQVASLQDELNEYGEELLAAELEIRNMEDERLSNRGATSQATLICKVLREYWEELPKQLRFELWHTPANPLLPGGS